MKNRKIKLVASTVSARVGAVLFSAIVIAAIVALISNGVLNFDEGVALTVGIIAVAAVVIILTLRVVFVPYILFDLDSKSILLRHAFGKEKHPLETVCKVQVEQKTIDLHVVSGCTEQQLKSGAACIKQTHQSKVHFKMPSRKDLNQRHRYETFAKKCNRILDEVIHKKEIREVYRCSPCAAISESEGESV